MAASSTGGPETASVTSLQDADAEVTEQITLEQQRAAKLAKASEAAQVQRQARQAELTTLQLQRSQKEAVERDKALAAEKLSRYCTHLQHICICIT